jgi:hypothetical protein
VPHWLLHFLGTDSGSGPAYLWWSGFGANFGELTIVAALLALVRQHNCHVHHCFRLGRHPVEGTSFTVCRKHHPDGHVSAEDVRKRYHLYLGRTPGKG